MKNPKQQAKPDPQNIIDIYYNQIQQAVPQARGRALLGIAVLLLLLGLMGLTWIIPFPRLGFLGAYNQYINWSSVFLAVVVYLLLRISPLLSYLMLFILFLLSYVVMQFIAGEHRGGTPVWLISGVLTIIGFGLLSGIVKPKQQLNALMITPVRATVWFLSSISKKLGVANLKRD